MNWYKKAAEIDNPLISLNEIPEEYGATRGKTPEQVQQNEVFFLNAFQQMSGAVEKLRGTDVADDKLLEEAILDARLAIDDFKNNRAPISPPRMMSIMSKLLKAMQQSEKVDKSDNSIYQSLKGIFPSVDLKLEEI